MNAAPQEIPAVGPLPRWLPAYVGIGSNLDDPRAQVEAAFTALARLRESRLVARSPLYRTAPLGEVPQPPFINAVAGMLTQLAPEGFLAALRALERELGREPPRQRWGPRRIDLDLLLLGSEVRASGELNLPHPGIAERDFVLYPLGDVAPELQVPGLGRVRQLRARVTDRGVVRL